MNKYLNAYLELLREIEIVGTEKPFLSKNMNNNLVMLHELVDKATPKKVSCPKGYRGYRYTRYYCPTCRKTLENSQYQYCKHCGQAIKYPNFKKENDKIVLDWSEDE